MSRPAISRGSCRSGRRSRCASRSTSPRPDAGFRSAVGTYRARSPCASRCVRQERPSTSGWRRRWCSRSPSRWPGWCRCRAGPSVRRLVAVRTDDPDVRLPRRNPGLHFRSGRAHAHYGGEEAPTGASVTIGATDVERPEQLRQRAAALRRSSAAISAGSAFLLPQRSGDDVWIGPTAGHFREELREILNTLRSAADTLLQESARLDVLAELADATAISP